MECIPKFCNNALILNSRNNGKKQSKCLLEFVKTCLFIFIPTKWDHQRQSPFFKCNLVFLKSNGLVKWVCQMALWTYGGVLSNEASVRPIAAEPAKAIWLQKLFKSTGFQKWSRLVLSLITSNVFGWTYRY